MTGQNPPDADTIQEDLEGKPRPAGAGTDPVSIPPPDYSGGPPRDDSALFDVERMSSGVFASSGVYNFVEEHGRTYHRYKEKRYWMPNDEKEQQRLELLHMICLEVFGGQLALAPVQNPT
ncbi:hypothetical protein F5X96DRAFT_668416 [Biscogniauxia mediterranea]|nr:hypothetical protein F5X96DRAFT_668416 [Biscogniauxia mediterranea]